MEDKESDLEEIASATSFRGNHITKNIDPLNAGAEAFRKAKLKLPAWKRELSSWKRTRRKGKETKSRIYGSGLKPDRQPD